MDYKKSRFNIIVPYKDDQFIIFNSYSGAFGKFDSAAMERYNSDTITSDEQNMLLAKRIIIPLYINELDQIGKDRAQGIFSGHKHFRIWPTSACNARCYYCFEHGIQTESMTTETADAIVDFIDHLIVEKDIVTIEWFGGEPLVNTYIIDYITQKLTDIFKVKHIKWSAFMISNGSLVNNEIVEKMVNFWKITRIQITLDGFGDDYNKAKNYYSPDKYSFSNVILNIKKLAFAGIRVSIRMNYDTINFESLQTLINYLHNEFYNIKNISYYIYPLWDALENHEHKFISKAKADRQFLSLLEILVNHGMATAKNLSRLGYRRHQCASCGIYNYSFLPNGEILKCSEAFNSVIGNVFKGIYDEGIAQKWTDPGIDEDCKECVYLPLCQGGCRASRVTDMPRCMVFKEIIPDLLCWNMKIIEEKCKRIV